jgi:Transposase DDE domain
MFYGISNGLKSLRQISLNAIDEHELKVSKQAIDDKFSSASVDFAKKLLTEAISTQVHTDIDTSELQLFKTVRIKDSTRFDLHESHAHLFESFGKGGGVTSKAGISIQFEFDIKSNKVLDIDLQSATFRDSKDALNKKDDLNKGDLIIRDLGYYSDTIIEQYMLKETFFISKLYHNVSVRMKEGGDKIDFNKLYYQMIKGKITQKDVDVYIGKKQRLVRLILNLIPDEEYQKRINQRNKENKSAGYTTTDELRYRAHFNIYICNIPRQECAAEIILKLYRVRWQIELIFKIWKSIMKIEDFRKMKTDRLLTTLYIKLLWILLNWQIISDCRNIFYKTNLKVLSIFKCFQTFNEQSFLLRKSVLIYKKNIESVILESICKIKDFHWSEKRNKRHNFSEIFSVLFSYSKINT